MSVASTSTSSDTWDQPLQAPLPARRAIPAQAIPDDWDNDSDEEDEGEDPQKLWENANNRAPMPQLVISASSTTSTVSPPPAAFQPTLRILKRPNASTTSSATAPSSDLQKSYAEREAQYVAARQRIFNDESARSRVTGRDNARDDNGYTGLRHAKTADGRAVDNAPPVSIIRDPRGPDSTLSDNPQAAQAEGQIPRGFRSRRGKGDSRG